MISKALMNNGGAAGLLQRATGGPKFNFLGNDQYVPQHFFLVYLQSCPKIEYRGLLYFQNIVFLVSKCSCFDLTDVTGAVHVAKVR